jgi:hypothetical protein
MADSITDEDIACRDPERWLTLQLDDEGSKQTRKKPNPQWCPNGLTKSQKRRVKRLCQLEQQEEAERCMLDKKKVLSTELHPKPKADDWKDNKPRVDINMVVFLPKEFMAPVDSDTSNEELGMAQLTLESNACGWRSSGHSNAIHDAGHDWEIRIRFNPTRQDAGGLQRNHFSGSRCNLRAAHHRQ